MVYLAPELRPGRILLLGETAGVLGSHVQAGGAEGDVIPHITPDNIVLKSSTVVGPIQSHQPILTDFSLARFSEAGDIFDGDGFEWAKIENALMRDAAGSTTVKNGVIGIKSGGDIIGVEDRHLRGGGEANRTHRGYVDP